MGRAAWAPRTVGEDCACARSGGRTEAGGAEPEQRWWAGTEARPIVPPPPNHPLCRGACAALGASRGRGGPRGPQRRRHGPRWVSVLGPRGLRPETGDQGSAERPGLRETSGSGGLGRPGVSSRPGVRRPGSRPGPAAPRPACCPLRAPFHVKGQADVKLDFLKGDRVGARALENARLGRRPRGIPATPTVSFIEWLLSS